MTEPTSIIEVLEYDPSWSEEFQIYASRLGAALGQLAMNIEHIGSTSVVGLAAKPIIDLDVVISSRIVLKEVIAKLALINYIHQGNLGIPGREVFNCPEGKRHHLYVCSVDTPNLHNHLIFRDYLRTHPDAVRAYSELKRRLALQHHDNRELYNKSKTKFIQSILAKAQSQYGFQTSQP